VSSGHWIQVSGASVLSIPDIVGGRFGEGSDRVYGDVDDANEVRDIIRQNAAKRVVDDYLLNKVSNTKTALVFPPIIYGQSRGPVKQRSVQIPELSRVAIETRETVQVGKGESTWSNVHIADVADVFVKLVEKAIEGSAGDFWNQNGLYFVGNGMLVSCSRTHIEWRLIRAEFWEDLAACR
jgi:nucleoside-diphosphate-sugar epimerase